MPSAWSDSPVRYGRVTRMLHWGMAALLAWQFTGMGVKLVLGRHPVSAFFVGTHKPLGTVLLLVILLRGAWALAQWRNRPPLPRTPLGRFAALGHGVLYALMLYIPCVALLREYGSGRGFAPWGLPLFTQTGEPIAWMLAPANLSHGLLAWTLLVVIAGHVAMVALHHWLWRDPTLAKMAGPL